jgi:hypothetical protein
MIMTHSHGSSKYFKWTIGFSLILLAVYFCEDILFKDLWVYSFIAWVVSGLSLLMCIVIGMLKKDLRVVLVLITVASIVTIFELLRSEKFKSEKLLVAVLDDDQSSLRLTLRKNNSFELTVTTMFTQETFKGQYKLDDNKIVFLSKPYNNDFIPDTVSIIQNKIILKPDQQGQQNTDFANFLDIQYNTLNKGP